MRVMILLALRTQKLGGIESYLAQVASALRAQGGQLIIVVMEAGEQVLARWHKAGAVVEQDLRLGGVQAPLRRWMRAHRPEVVILQFFPLKGPMAWLCKLAGAPKVIVVDDHSSPASRRASSRSSLRRVLYRASLWPASRVVAVSGFVSRRHERDYQLSVMRRRRVDNGVREVEDGLSVQSLWQQAAKQQVVLAAGYMIEEKGFMVLMEAMELLCARQPEATLWLVGTGPQEVALRERAAALGVPATFLGSRDDVSELMALAHVVVVPSLWDEAFGLVTAEAMMASCAVVATEVGASVELLDEGRAGWLVPAGDAPALAYALERLLGDDALRARVGERAHQRAMTYYHVERMVAQMIQLCEEVVCG